MTVTVSLLFIISLIFILLSSKADIKIVISKNTRVEITFTLFTLVLSDFDDGGRKKSSFSKKRRIFSSVLSLLEKCELTVEKLRLGRGRGRDFAPTSYTLPYGYHIAISALLAYIRGKSQKLNIDDNAIILIPDEDEEFSLTVSLRTRLFYVLTCAARIRRDTKEIEKKGRKRNYVGN